MSDFKQAIKWMKEGKKVRLKNWGNKNLYGYSRNNWIHFMDGGRDFDAHFLNEISTLEADDWEIYEEEEGLKTLKDIESQFHTPTDNIIGSELRQEAIKWIKSDRKFAEGLREGFVKKGDIPGAFEMLIIRWKDRFNIKEEDLK